MIAQPLEALREDVQTVRRDYKPGDAVGDDLRHTGHRRADCGNAARHTFEQSLSQEFRDFSLAAVHIAKDTRQDDAKSVLIKRQQVLVVAGAVKRDELSL